MESARSGSEMATSGEVATSGNPLASEEEESVAGPQLASSAREVYADEPFAGTIFEKSGRSREWVDTVPKSDPTRLSELMQSREVSGTVVIETHAGDTVEVEVGSSEEEAQEASPEAKRRWKQAGEAKARKEMQKEKGRLRERLEDRLQTREERLRQQEERIKQLKGENDRLRREKAEKVEAEREKRREKVEAEREKRRKKVSELREKNQELERELLEAKSGEHASPFGKAIEKLVDEGAHQQLLTAVAGNGAQQAGQAEQSRRSQPAQPPQQVAGDGRAGHPPEPEPQRSAQSAQGGGQETRERNARERNAQGRDARGQEGQRDVQNGAHSGRESQHGGAPNSPQSEIPEGADPEEVKKAEVAKSGYVALVQGREEELYDQLRRDEDVKGWAKEDWMEALHGLAILCEKEGVEPRGVAELLEGDLDYYLAPGVRQMIAAARTRGPGDVADLLIDQMATEVAVDVREYVTSVIRELQDLL